MPLASQLPKISVVTPSYNQARYLRDTIESVLTQGYPFLEYIVIDGGSDDGSVEILKEYDDQIDYWVSEKDNGQSHAINKGFAQATGEIFCWLNSDDQFAPDALWSMAIAFVVTNADLIAGICEVYEDDQLIHRHLTACANGKLPLNDLLDLENGWNAGQFFYQPEVFFTKSAWLKAGAYVREDCYYSMDYELWCRMALAELELHVVGTPIVHFRSHPEQKTADPTKFKQELQQVRDAFLAEHSLIQFESNRPAANWNRKLKIALLNDHGYQYGAGIAQLRIAGAFDLAAQHVACFTLKASQKHDFTDVFAAIKRFTPDLVILGNLHGVSPEFPPFIYDLESIAPVYWVTHDFWLMTGRCAYMSTCEMYIKGCDTTCPTASQYPVIPSANIHNNWQNKREYLVRSKMRILANSNWAKSKFDSYSRVLGRAASASVIKLGVPNERFYPVDKQAAKLHFKIAPSRFTLAFSASSLSDERKGARYLSEALIKLAERHSLAVILIGRDDVKFIENSNIQVVTTGFTNDTEALRTAFSAADLYVGPSLEETFGQVYIEAAMCGVPSVGFKTSGVQEAIVEGVTGMMASKISAGELASVIEYLIDNFEIRRALAKSAVLYARSFHSLEASYHSFFQCLRNDGIIDTAQTAHKIHFSSISELVSKQTMGWSELSLFEKLSTRLRSLADSLIAALPPKLTAFVRNILPKPVEGLIMKWLSGRKY